MNHHHDTTAARRAARREAHEKLVLRAKAKMGAAPPEQPVEETTEQTDVSA